MRLGLKVERNQKYTHQTNRNVSINVIPLCTGVSVASVCVRVCSFSPRAPRRGPAFLCIASRLHTRTEGQSSVTIPCMCLVFTHIFISHHFSFVRRPSLRSFCNNSRFFRRSVLFRVFASIHTHAFYHSRKKTFF